MTGVDARDKMNPTSIKSVCAILAELHRCEDHCYIHRVERETIFWLYEGGAEQKWSLARLHSLAARELALAARGSTPSSSAMTT